MHINALAGLEAQRLTVYIPSFLPPCRRTDLEKAIAAHGGPGAVAEALGWSRKGKSRKPRGFWDELFNVKQEVDDFIEEHDLEPGGLLGLKDCWAAGCLSLKLTCPLCPSAHCCRPHAAEERLCACGAVRPGPRR